MVEFSAIDYDDISTQLRISERATNAGRVNEPSVDDLQYDECQNAIVHTIGEALNQARDTARSAISHIEQRRSEIESQRHEGRCSEIPNDAHNQIMRLRSDHKPELTDLRKGERRMLREYRAFMKHNQINREPHYPDSKMFHWSIVLALVVIESVANSYFFAKGSDLGLLGGGLQALLISLANVGSALFFGVYVLPQLFHVKTPHRVVASLVMTVYGGILVSFNLATAHYRTLLEIDPENALVRTIPHLLESWFGIDNFDAWILFMIGLLFAFLALVKGVTSDDIYPGFGKTHRRYLAARDAYDLSKANLKNAVNHLIDKLSAELETIATSARRDAKEYTRLNQQHREMVHSFNDYGKHAENTCNKLLHLYREDNEAIRTDPSPSYFKLQHHFGDQRTMQDPDLSEAVEYEIQINKFADHIDEIVAEQREQLRSINKQTIDEFDDFFTEIEEEAMAQEADDDSFVGKIVPQSIGA